MCRKVEPSSHSEAVDIPDDVVEQYIEARRVFEKVNAEFCEYADLIREEAVQQKLILRTEELAARRKEGLRKMRELR